MDTLWQFVTQYGYWAVVLGGLVEGETLLILAGFAARLGHLDLLAVMAVGAFMGAFSDVLLFSLGRWRADRQDVRHAADAPIARDLGHQR